MRLKEALEDSEADVRTLLVLKMPKVGLCPLNAWCTEKANE